MFYMYRIVSKLVDIIQLLILIRVLISWLAPYSNNSLVRAIYTVTEPILGPIRNSIYSITRTNIDFSPIIAYFLLNLIRSIAFRILNILIF